MMTRSLAALGFLALSLGSAESAATPVEVPGATWVPSTARYLIDVGDFAFGADTSPDLSALARSTVVGRLATESSVLLGDGTTDRVAIARMLRRHHLQGYLFNGRVRVAYVSSAVRVEVSLLVQTNPTREYRFESAVSVTLSGVADPTNNDTVATAMRRAVLSATTRAMGQLGEG